MFLVESVLSSGCYQLKIEFITGLISSYETDNVLQKDIEELILRKLVDLALDCDDQEALILYLQCLDAIYKTVSSALVNADKIWKLQSHLMAALTRKPSYRFISATLPAIGTLLNSTLTSTSDKDVHREEHSSCICKYLDVVSTLIHDYSQPGQRELLRFGALKFITNVGLRVLSLCTRPHEFSHHSFPIDALEAICVRYVNKYH